MPSVETVAPEFSDTNSTGSSPYTGWARPTTAASAISGSW